MAGTVIFPRVRRLSDRRAREHRFLTDVAQRRGIIPAHSFTRPSYATGAPMRASLLAINIPASYVRGGGGGGKRAAPDRILSCVWLFAKCLLSDIFFRRQFLLQTKLKIPCMVADKYTSSLGNNHLSIFESPQTLPRMDVRNLYGSDFRD